MLSHLILVAVLAVELLSQGAARGASLPPTQPASLSNQEFWSIVTEFSEQSGVFPYDNYTSNELMIGQVAADLVAGKRTGGAYIGVGPEQNFTYIAATKPDIAFIVDIRRQAVMQHLMYKALFEMSNNRSEFIARLFSKPVQAAAQSDTAIRDIWARYLPIPADSKLFEANLAAIHRHLTKVRGFALSPDDSASIGLVFRAFYQNGPFIAYASRVGPRSVPVNYTHTAATFVSLTMVTDLVGVPRSFLASNANFRTVKTLHSRNLIIPVVGNFGGPKALRRVGDFLRANGFVLASHYTSNVEGYLFKPPMGGSRPVWREYYSNLAAMPVDSNSIFIRSNGLGVDPYSVLRLMRQLPLAAAPPHGFRNNTPVTFREPPAPPRQLPHLGAFSGRVIDSISGSPLYGARVRIEGQSLSAIVDGSGRFVIRNVAPGSYTLAVISGSHAEAIARERKITAGYETVVEFRTVPAAVRAGRVSETSARTDGQSTLRKTPVVFCPVAKFLAAYSTGAVTTAMDVEACAL